jgi:hypothetical protein
MSYPRLLSFRDSSSRRARCATSEPSQDLEGSMALRDGPDEQHAGLPASTNALDLYHGLRFFASISMAPGDFHHTSRETPRGLPGPGSACSASEVLCRDRSAPHSATPLAPREASPGPGEGRALRDRIRWFGRATVVGAGERGGRKGDDGAPCPAIGAMGVPALFSRSTPRFAVLD